jgi:hypothetical protein
MTKTKWFAVCLAFAAWLLPAFASAQMPNPGQMIQLRADDPLCGEGYTCFRVGAYRPGGVTRTFERMLGIVNRGRPEASHVTMEQLEAANECGVMYVRNGRPSAANGVCSRNGTTERVTFESFCGGRACARWPYANRVYRVPSVRILTPDERAEEMAREIASAVDTATVPAPASLGANLRELIELRRSGQPPTDEHEAAVLTAMADALDRTSGAASSDMTFEAPEADAPPVSDAAELAALRSQVERLTQERDEARGAIDGRWPWWVTILACLIGMLALFFIGRRSVPRTRVEDEEASSEPMVPKWELDNALERARSAENSVESLRAWWLAIKEVFEKATGKSDPTANEVGEFVKNASLNTEERKDLKLFRDMREEWKTTPRLGLEFGVATLATVLGAWLRLEGLEKAWRGMTPAFVTAGNVPDGGLRAYVDHRVDTEVQTALALRKAEYEARIDEINAGMELYKSDVTNGERKRAFDLVEERLGAKLDELHDEFAAITSGDPGREAVDADLIRSVFGLGRRKIAPFYAFLQGVLDRATAARTELDELLGRRKTDDAAEATPIDPEATRIARNPLLEAESASGLPELPSDGTNPFAQHPDFTGSNGNGSSRDDPTVQVRNNGGRERRNTHRGIGFADAAPPPIAEPALPSDGSSDGE